MKLIGNSGLVNRARIDELFDGVKPYDESAKALQITLNRPDSFPKFDHGSKEYKRHVMLALYGVAEV